eukprot:Phypoly_transcript_05367.p1 GENE.Phypoly_transcript_05367~~Phypoly_transcript_05367.p1  ORF type:complete len:444 (+),score=41.31 Phypoly_transcript_05367:175-1332(+)
MASSPLKSAGYEYILIDDCWSACLNHTKSGNCRVPAPRDANGHIMPDPNKFPSGMKALADYVHGKGLKIGIYTAASALSCAGYLGSLGHEHVDAQQFADWGIDFVKMDTCSMDCGIHTGCIQNVTGNMRDGLNATGRRVVFYVDDGNDSSGPRVYNPFMRSFNPDIFSYYKIAYTPDELVWNWGPDTCNMWKSWLDIHDSWYSTVDNLHMQIGLAMTQKCGAFNTPDMLTVGQGAQSKSEYRAQFFMWSVLGAPLIMGHDIRKTDNFTMRLLTAPEVIAIDQDPDCVQASFASSFHGAEVWVKPLHDNTFAVVLLNLNSHTQNIKLQLNYKWHHNFGHFYPSVVTKAKIRDVWHRRDLGVYSDIFEHEVGGHDAMILKVYPLSDE